MKSPYFWTSRLWLIFAFLLVSLVNLRSAEDAVLAGGSWGTILGPKDELTVKPGSDYKIEVTVKLVDSEKKSADITVAFTFLKDSQPPTNTCFTIFWGRNPPPSARNNQSLKDIQGYQERRMSLFGQKPIYDIKRGKYLYKIDGLEPGVKFFLAQPTGEMFSDKVAKEVVCISNICEYK
jgi:hypothetical protein